MTSPLPPLPASASTSFSLGPEITAGLEALVWIAPCLLLSGFFAMLRVALLHSHGPRVMARTDSVEKRRRIEPLLARADRLAISAGILEAACDLGFVALLLRYFAGESAVSWMAIGKTLVIGVPALLVLSEALPTAIALRRGDRLLLFVLPAFDIFQLPLRWLVSALEGVRRALMRIVGLRPSPASARQIVEGLREVIEDSEISGELGDTEREIISNVMEFHDVNVAAVMTPRTEIQGVDIAEGLLAAARKTAESGHSRIPVFDGSLDTIVGVITARDVVQVAAEQGLEKAALRSILRPAYFVPETKRVSELLAEFRREKIKLAVVLDEYGGTAGLVTLGDIISEIVGDMQDEFDEQPKEPIRRLSDGAAEVDASLHVSEVNEELALEIPEGEDYETLAGFVLSEFGRFPRRGEKLEVAGVELTVLEASDRRVLKVKVRSLPNALSI